MKRWKPLAVLGLVAASIAVLAASSDGFAASSRTSSSKAVTLVWWHNANQGAGLALWKQVVKEYHAQHPDVTVKAVAFDSNVLQQTKIPIALASNNPPDVFQEWGGGALVDEVKAKKVQNLTKYVKPWIKSIGGSAAGWQVNGRRYAVPYSVGVVGFWYNKQLFSQAGIASAPTSWPQLLAAITKLKAAGITPISVGGRDRWPDAFYWDYLATKLCSKSTMQQAATTYNSRTRAGSRRATPCSSSWTPSPSRPASLRHRRNRSRRARPACSRTARSPWSCKVTGTQV